MSPCYEESIKLIKNNCNKVACKLFQKFEKLYYEQLRQNEVTPKTQFEYAWCLVRSKYPADIKKGILFLEELCNTHQEGQREYLYFLAIGNARIKEYTKAMRCVRSCLDIEPNNHQVSRLEMLIKKRMTKEGLATKIFGTLAFASIATAAFLGYKLLRRYNIP